jgi:hypothetical protein
LLFFSALVVLLAQSFSQTTLKETSCGRTVMIFMLAIGFGLGGADHFLPWALL